MKDLSKLYDTYIKNLDRVSKENEKEKFLGKFIANSNAIEGSTLSVKETHNLLFNDIIPTGHKKKELFMATNMLKAWEYLEKNCKRMPKQSDLLKLHKYVNANIEEEETLGKYKGVQNYIGDVLTSSFLFTQERMDQLLKWINQAFKKIDDFEVAFQSHAQFEIIHPFIDGNGRVGRLILNWLLIYKGLNPLAIKSEKKNIYINALDIARKKDLREICKFCYNEYLEQYKFVK